MPMNFHARFKRRHDNFALQEPTNADEIVDSSKCPVEVGVFRLTGFSLAVINVNFGNRQSSLGKNGREIAMQAIERHE